VVYVLVLAGLGFGLLLLGGKMGYSLLTAAGFCCLAAASVWIGVETMITRRIVATSRYDRRANETYVGIAAIAQGIQLVLLGVFLATIAILFQLDLGAPLVRHFVRRPGGLLLLFGFAALTTAIIVGVGYVEQKEAPRFAYILDLLTSRLLGGVLLTVIGLAAVGLGLLEVFAPALFDTLGGGYLEAIYGSRAPQLE